MHVTLRVDRAWKGVESGTVVVLTGQGGGDCGPGRSGKSYLVFADGGPASRWLPGVCGRTAELSRAAEDVAELGEPGAALAAAAADGRGRRVEQ
jgi:hypothetical protein